jgi:hypothetical protein
MPRHKLSITDAAALAAELRAAVRSGDLDRITRLAADLETGSYEGDLWTVMHHACGDERANLDHRPTRQILDFAHGTYERYYHNQVEALATGLLDGYEDELILEVEYWPELGHAWYGLDQALEACHGVTRYEGQRAVIAHSNGCMENHLTEFGSEIASAASYGALNLVAREHLREAVSARLHELFNERRATLLEAQEKDE